MKRPALKNFRRIVVKVGSSLLIDSAKGEVRASCINGKLEAQNEAALVQRLRSMGYAPISVKQTNSGLSREIKLPGSDKVDLKDLAVMSRQFATMIDSGLSLLRALTILAEHH